MAFFSLKNCRAKTENQVLFSTYLLTVQAVLSISGLQGVTVIENLIHWYTHTYFSRVLMSLRSGIYVNIGLHILFFSFQNYSVFYEDWSFMMDEERSSMIPTMAAGKTFS